MIEQIADTDKTLLVVSSPCMVLGKGQKNSPYHKDELLRLELESCKCSVDWAEKDQMLFQ